MASVLYLLLGSKVNVNTAKADDAPNIPHFVSGMIMCETAQLTNYAYTILIHYIH